MNFEEWKPLTATEFIEKIIKDNISFVHVGGMILFLVFIETMLRQGPLV